MPTQSRYFCLALVAVALLSPARPADAQSDRFKGVGAVKLEVSGVDADAIKCGVRADLVDAVVRVAISNSRLAVHVPSTGESSVWSTLADLYVPTYTTSILAIALSDGRCAVSVQATFARQVSWRASNLNGPTFDGMATVWTDATLMTGSSSGIGKRVADTSEGMAKVFLGAWLKSNP